MFLFKRIILGSYAFIVANLARAVLLLFIVIAVGNGISFVPKAEKYGILNKMMKVQIRIQAPVTKYLAANVPTKFSGVDAAPWMFAAGLFVLWIGLAFEKDRLDNLRFAVSEEQEAALKLKALAKEEKAEREVQRAEAIELAKKQKNASQAMKILSKAKNIGRVGTDGKGATLPPHGSKREELLELYAQTKKTLEASKKHLAFLAIDVVNSTGMKKDEDAALAERDFRQYKHLVEKAIADNEGIKSSWTPDGVMICFTTAAGAVRAAQQVIGGLVDFNKNIKSIKAEFRVRAGINSGRVLFDEATPMEEMSDRTIDIAGHMQKYAGVNAILIGKDAIAGMSDHGFKSASKQVDGLDVCIWESDAETVVPA